MEYAAFLHDQAAALVAQYFDTRFNAAFIAIAAPESLSRRQMVDGGRIVTMPGYPASDALLWQDDKGRTELWVRTFDKTANPSDLYEHAWRDYVRVFAKTEMRTELNGRPMVIDHLYPETAAFRSKLAFVRLLAIERRPNSLVGSAIEKLAAGPKPGKDGRDRTATSFTLAKVSGFQGSFARRNAARDVMRALYGHLRAKGYPVPAEGTALAALEADIASSVLEWFRDT
jgi:hypothetical protein